MPTELSWRHRTRLSSWFIQTEFVIRLIVCNRLHSKIRTNQYFWNFLFTMASMTVIIYWSSINLVGSWYSTLHLLSLLVHCLVPMESRFSPLIISNVNDIDV